MAGGELSESQSFYFPSVYGRADVGSVLFSSSFIVVAGASDAEGPLVLSDMFGIDRLGRVIITGTKSEVWLEFLPGKNLPGKKRDFVYFCIR